MNKLPILGFALLLSSSLLAQSKIAIGLDIKPQMHSIIGKNNFVNSQTQHREVTLNLSAELALDYLINENYSISSGLSYNPQGISKEQINVADFGNRSFEANVDYVRIPIGLTFYLSKFGDYRINLSVGLGMNYLLTVKDNLGEVMDFINCVCDDPEVRYNKLVFDSQMSTGLEYHLTESVLLLTELKMLLGINRYHKPYPIGSNADIEINSRVISLGLGVGVRYRFK